MQPSLLVTGLSRLRMTLSSVSASICSAADSPERDSKAQPASKLKAAALSHLLPRKKEKENLPEGINKASPNGHNTKTSVNLGRRYAPSITTYADVYSAAQTSLLNTRKSISGVGKPVSSSLSTLRKLPSRKKTRLIIIT